MKKKIIIGAVAVLGLGAAIWFFKGEEIKNKATEKAAEAIIETTVDKVTDKATEELKENIIKLIP